MVLVPLGFLAVTGDDSPGGLELTAVGPPAGALPLREQRQPAGVAATDQPDALLSSTTTTSTTGLAGGGAGNSGGAAEAPAGPAKAAATVPRTAETTVAPPAAARTAPAATSAEPAPVVTSATTAPPTTATTAARSGPTLNTIAPPSPAPTPAPTANRDRGRATWFNAPDGTCAHRTIAVGTVVRVTRVSDNSTTTCVVDQWGPAERSVVIDLSMDTFERLAPAWVGVIEVIIEW